MSSGECLIEVATDRAMSDAVAQSWRVCAVLQPTLGTLPVLATLSAPPSSHALAHTHKHTLAHTYVH